MLGFFNRERDLKRAQHFLLHHEHVAQRSLWSVHGATRCGKSHLVRRALLDPKLAEAGMMVFVIQANGEMTAHNVLKRILRELSGPVLNRRMAPHIAMSAERFTLTQKNVEVALKLLGLGADFSEMVVVGDAISGGLALGVGDKGIAGLGLDVKAQHDRRLERRDTYRSISDEQLVDVIAHALELLIDTNHGRPVVLFVDDIDLLQSGGVEGGAESEMLIRLLSPLAGVARLIPIVATRYAFFNGHNKSLVNFLPVSILTSAEIVAVHKHRIAAFHGGAAIFTDDALNFLAAKVDGRIGMFQKYCHDIWSDDVAQAMPIDLDRVNDFLALRLRRWRADRETGPVMNQVFQAAREHRMQIEPVLDPRTVGLYLNLLEPAPGGSARGYVVSELFVEAIAKLSKSEP